MSPRLLLAVAVGGAVGACLRWTVQDAATVPPGGFPWPTLVVNVSGSALLAALVALRPVQARRVLGAGLGSGVLGGCTTLSATSEETRALVGVGVCGALTTYSTFAVQAWERGPRLGLLTVVLTVPAALAACTLGFAVTV